MLRYWRLRSSKDFSPFEAISALCPTKRQCHHVYPSFVSIRAIPILWLEPVTYCTIDPPKLQNALYCGMGDHLFQT